MSSIVPFGRTADSSPRAHRSAGLDASREVMQTAFRREVALKTCLEAFDQERPTGLRPCRLFPELGTVPESGRSLRGGSSTALADCWILDKREPNQHF